ncbi:MAG: pantoate--beta-alanine ligase [Actinomycetota bacterium]
MKIVRTKGELRRALGEERRQGRSIGFVPTMGSFHEGHLELMRRARRCCDCVVVSIFVNPFQFGPSEDFEGYPRDLDRDGELAAGIGVDWLFAPSVEEMYPGGTMAMRLEVGRIGEVGEGRWRPGFFSGVATVCLKLFHLVGADRAYFGQKDAQQLAVIRQVVAELDLPLEVVACPTVREADGLAASSRNVHLDAGARRAATALPHALLAAREAAAAGERSAEGLAAAVQESLGKEPGMRLQYVEVFDPETFEPVSEIRGPAVLAAAAFAGGVRLIDNVEVGVGAGLEPGGGPC